MEIRFDGKRALVTGAGRGIGRDIAKALHKCGAEVYALSKTQEHLDSLVKEYPGIHPVQCDLADWEVTRKTVHDLGDIHLLVNNAGIVVAKPFLELTPEDFDSVLNVNLKAVFNVCQVVAGGMVTRGSGGSIVNISSISGLVGTMERGVYGPSKAALDQMTRNMAREFGPHKIRVNCVNPSVTMTDMGRDHWYTPEAAKTLQNLLARTPLGRVSEVEDITGPVVFLLSDLSAMITGHCLPIDGGFVAT